MSNITAKTSSNIFYQARYKAASHNEQLSSREGAADIMLIDRGRLYRIESGLVNPHPEEIHLMADLYNAPELKNFYCCKICPLGADVPIVDMENLDRITVKALSAFNRVKMTRELLLDITEDGIIDETEKDDLQIILKNLEELEAITENLKVWIKKNL